MAATSGETPGEKGPGDNQKPAPRVVATEPSRAVREWSPRASSEEPPQALIEEPPLALIEEPPLALIEEPPQALDQLFEAHHVSVYRAAYRVTGKHADAEDVLQTVFVRLLQRSPVGMADAGAYLRRASVNAALDVLRRRAHDSGIPADESAVDSVSTEEMRHAAELKNQLRRALAALGGRAAEVFALHYFEQYENHEIAMLLDTSPNTIGVTLHRARQQLQRTLGHLQGDCS